MARVLAGEAEPSAPEAAQQALAIAVRTFAIFNAGRHRRDGYDLCDTTHCQVPRTATAATRAAALATAGRILTYKGSPAEVFYSASCGGRSENAARVWPGVDLPYLRSVVDNVHDDDVPWTLEMTLRDVQQALAANGFAGSRLTEVRVDERNESGRVMRLRLRGLQPDVIAGDQFRAAIGTREVRSTAFSVSRQGNTLRFTGRGYGHGVGMCVIGAGRRARRGESADAILATYYPGVVVDSAPLALARAPIDTGAEPAAPTPRSGEGGPVASRAAGEVASVTPAREIVATSRVMSGIIARVPRGSAVTATELERQATRARDSLSKALGTSVTPITIELHESLDRFRDVTGRPWWVSAVASGTAIDLAPAAVLEQRGGVEPVLRQAMAELFVAPALVNRPVWVKVGAARYFARTTAAPAAGNVRCPSDAELTLAISAAAQREAETRAESCFARALAHTHDWRAVRGP